MKRSRDSTEHLLKEESFRRMFESHFARVLRHVEGRVADHAIAEEISAEVFRTAWQKLDAAAPFGLPWLIRTAMAKTRQYQRHEHYDEAAEAALARLIAEPGQDRAVLDRIAVLGALRGLSRKELHIVRLTYWDELTEDEVSQVLRMRRAAVRTGLERARGQLRLALSDHALSGGRDG